MPERTMRYVNLDLVQPAKRNPKKHANITGSLGRFGYVEPMVLDVRTGRLVAGHGRLEALRQMRSEGQKPPQGIMGDGAGGWLVPAIEWESRSDEEAEAYLLASNRLTELGGWEKDSLAAIIAELNAKGALDGVGYDSKEISKLLDRAGLGEGKSDPDDIPEVTAPSRVKPGDVWQLGDHRIVCGDCTDHGVAMNVFEAGELADICWTDPPWNVAYGGPGSTAESRNRAGAQNSKRAIINDNLGDKFPQFCRDFIGSISMVLKPGGMLYMVMSAQEWPTIDGALRGSGFHWSSTIIWAKDTAVLSRKDYHTRYEPIWYGWKDDGPRLFPLDDRKQNDVWDIPRPKKSEEHPMMKPVELISRSLVNSSARGSIVFEPFSGSGSVIIACEQTGRKARAVELDTKYVQVAIERWEKFTGRIATKL